MVALFYISIVEEDIYIYIYIYIYSGSRPFCSRLLVCPACLLIFFTSDSTWRFLVSQRSRSSNRGGAFIIPQKRHSGKAAGLITRSPVECLELLLECDCLIEFVKSASVFLAVITVPLSLLICLVHPQLLHRRPRKMREGRSQWLTNLMIPGSWIPMPLHWNNFFMFS